MARRDRAASIQHQELPPRVACTGSPSGLSLISCLGDFEMRARRSQSAIGANDVWLSADRIRSCSEPIRRLIEPVLQAGNESTPPSER